MILDISYYDPYHGIEIEGNGINVETGHYPFDLQQKFMRGQMKFRAVEFKFAPVKEKIVTDVTFETIREPKERFNIPILRVLESIKQGRTKFSL